MYKRESGGFYLCFKLHCSCGTAPGAREEAEASFYHIGALDWRKRENQYLVDRYSSVGISTRYELDGMGIEFRWRRDFLHQSRPALGPTQPPIQGSRVFPGGKAAGAWRC